MIKYIPLEPLVAEIDKRLHQLTDAAFDSMIGRNLIEIKDFLDTLEVKEVDLEKDVRQIISLYYKGIKYYEDVIRKEREENGGSDLAIKIMDGIADAKELSIQYVLDKLKAQKGE